MEKLCFSSGAPIKILFLATSNSLETASVISGPNLPSRTTSSIFSVEKSLQLSSGSFQEIRLRSARGWNKGGVQQPNGSIHFLQYTQSGMQAAECNTPGKKYHPLICYTGNIIDHLCTPDKYSGHEIV